MAYIYCMAVQLSFDKPVNNPEDFEAVMEEALEQARQDAQLDIEGQTPNWVATASLDFVEQQP